MAAPQVRKLNNIISELGKGVAGQKAQIDADILRSEQSGVAQQEGLAAQQKQAFGQIEQAASNKGMLFSGFSPDAQAEYTSTTYLPALAKLQEAIASTRAGLLGKKTDIDSDVYARAVGIRESDIGAKRSWDISDADRRAAKAEAERNRRFQADQNAKQIAAENARAAASRAASQQSAPSAAQYIADWASTISKDNSNYKKNYSWENSGIAAQLKTQYGLSGQQAYALRKSILGY